MRPLAYILIQRTDLPGLEQAVNSILTADTGWTPQGGISIVPLPNGQFLYTQAMVTETH